MAIFKPGRLYRKLPDIPKPLFMVTTANIGTLNDDQIRSIIINRGKADNSGGVHPSTVEIALAANQVAKAGEVIDVRLTGLAATALAARFAGDPDTAGYIAPRFHGRVGMQQMEDHGRVPFNTVFGASWSAQLSHSPDRYALDSGTAIQLLLERILEPTYLAPRITVLSQGTLDRLFGAVEGTYSDLIGKFAADIGILVRDRRAGELEILSLAYRRDTTLAAVPTSIPLTRSQAISPAEWVQPNEGPPVAYRLTRRDNLNVIQTSIIGAADGSEPIEDVDWTYFREYSDQWRYIHAMRASGFDDRFRVETVTVDLLHLLNSPYQNHWDQAGYLLKMQHGDPVFLSADWPTPLRGIHFAEGIREEITKDKWEITLNLIRFREIVGEETVPVPARVWNGADQAWDTETRKWDEA